MRLEDVLVSPAAAGRTTQLPIDIELEALDAELEAAGNRARRTLNGQRQPTRYFAIELRRQLLDSVDVDAVGTPRETQRR
jgi:hypothetical protein